MQFEAHAKKGSIPQNVQFANLSSLCHEQSAFSVESSLGYRKNPLAPRLVEGVVCVFFLQAG